MLPSGEELRARPNDLRLQAAAPWFHAGYLPALRLSDYVDLDGYLPGGIPACAVCSFEWARRIAVRENDLSGSVRCWAGGRWLRARLEPDPWIPFVEAVRLKVSYLRGPFFHFRDGIDLWRARNDREAGYVRQMLGLRGLIQAWESMEIVPAVHPAGILCSEKLLPDDYRDARKANSSFWSDTVRFERRFRSEHGYFIFWHDIEANCLLPAALEGRYVPVPPWWQDWEMPQGFWAELPPVLAYVGSEVLRNPNSGWWVIHRTQWVVHIAIYLVWDAFDTGRLWYCPPHVLGALRALPLEYVLGADGANDLRRFTVLIERTDWDSVPPHQSQRQQSKRYNFCPGRTATAGDFIWVDANSGRPVRGWIAKRKRAERYGGRSPFPRARRYHARRHASSNYENTDIDKLGARNQDEEARELGSQCFVDGSNSSSENVKRPKVGSADSNSVHGVASPEVIEISSDSDAVSPEREGIPREETADKIGGRNEKSLGTCVRQEEDIIDELDCSTNGGTRSFVQYDSSAIEVIHRCLEELIVPPSHGFAPNSFSLREQLRELIDGYQEYLAENIDYQVPKEDGGSWRQRTFFDKKAMLVIHHYLGSVAGIPHGGFGQSTPVLRRQMYSYLEHLRNLARERCRI